MCLSVQKRWAPLLVGTPPLTQAFPVREITKLPPLLITIVPEFVKPLKVNAPRGSITSVPLFTTIVPLLANHWLLPPKLPTNVPVPAPFITIVSVLPLMKLWAVGA